VICFGVGGPLVPVPAPADVFDVDGSGGRGKWKMLCSSACGVVLEGRKRVMRVGGRSRRSRLRSTYTSGRRKSRIAPAQAGLGRGVEHCRKRGMRK
jgi:hypothetical protein